jgi:deoxyribonuclease-4
MMRIGFHVSILGRIDEAIDRILKLDCNTFQIFTRNPRSWRAKPLVPEHIKAFQRKIEMFNLKPVFGHISYLVNLASSKQDVYSKSIKVLKEELERCCKLNIPYLVSHLGSHLGVGKKKGFKRIISAIDTSLKTKCEGVMLLLENTAGTRNSMGSTFEDLQYIFLNLSNPENVGFCFDTCHGFAAGYDLRNQRSVKETIRILTEKIGFEKLRLIHINDSKGSLGSGIDRHEQIGLGKIGEEGFRAILKSRFNSLPMILETPKTSSTSDIENLRKVRQLIG